MALISGAAAGVSAVSGSGLLGDIKGSVGDAVGEIGDVLGIGGSGDQSGSLPAGYSPPEGEVAAVIQTSDGNQVPLRVAKDGPGVYPGPVLEQIGANENGIGADVKDGYKLILRDSTNDQGQPTGDKWKVTPRTSWPNKSRDGQGYARVERTGTVPAQNGGGQNGGGRATTAAGGSGQMILYAAVAGILLYVVNM
jgi:hypothetical protein